MVRKYSYTADKATYRHIFSGFERKQHSRAEDNPILAVPISELSAGPVGSGSELSRNVVWICPLLVLTRQHSSSGKGFADIGSNSELKKESWPIQFFFQQLEVVWSA